MNPNDPNNANHDPLNFDEDDLLAAENRLGEDDDDNEPKGVSLAEIWRNNPSLKIFAVVLVIGIFLIVFLVFGGDEEANPSAVGGTSSVNQPPGTAQLPPAYEDAVKAASEQRAVNAEMTGGSSIPTPIGTAERIEAPPSVENVDPLAEWRRAAEQRASQRRETDQVTLPPPPPVQMQPMPQQQMVAVQQQQRQQPPALPTNPNQQEVDQMAQRLADYMKAIVDNQTPRASSLLTTSVPTGFELEKDNKVQMAGMQNQNGSPNNATPPETKVIIAAGTIGYAQTLITSNSDVPGPVLAELASGPLSGARLLGSFQVQDDFMVLKFNRAVYKGKEYSIDAFALDPATTLPAMATDVDHHYMSRILIPAAARFIQGYAQAISQRGTTVVVNNSSTIAAQDPLNGRQASYQGAAEAAQQLSQVVQQDARKPVTVEVAAGTRMGVLFVTSVTEKSGDPSLTGTPAYQQQQDAARAYVNQPQQQAPGLNTQPTSSTGVPDSAVPVITNTSTYPGYPTNAYSNGYNMTTTAPRVITTGTPVR
jgi:intracellular multiplication protein IcmE